MNLEGWTGWVVTAVVLIAFVLAVWLDARRWLRREPVVPPEPPEPPEPPVDPYWQDFEERLLAARQPRPWQRTEQQRRD